MKKIIFLGLFALFSGSTLFTAEPELDLDDDFLLDEEDGAEEPPKISDPLRAINRPIFVFNDKFYQYVAAPVGRGYTRVMPAPVRRSIGNFFSNLMTPVRLVNNLLQGKVRRSTHELARFAINSTSGLGGLFDPARSHFKLTPHFEDMGQTLGTWRIPPGPALQIPLLGPTNLRDLLGSVADGFLNPLYHEVSDEYKKNIMPGLVVLQQVNETAPRLDEYLALRKNAIDPYTFFRDAYDQVRRRQVKE